MKCAWRCVVILLVVSLAAAGPALAQTATAAMSVPRLVKFSGTLRDGEGKPLTGTTGVTFALYADQQNGAPLWIETQNVTPDANGHYSVSLGAASAEGLPLELFSSGEARWLGVQGAGQREQPRVLLLSVPYALKAADAETIGGLPPSAFVLAAPSSSSPSPPPQDGPAPAPAITPANPTDPDTITKNFLPLFLDNTGTLGNSAMFQSGSGGSAKIGIGTTAPTAMLDVKGTATVRGNLALPSSGVATADSGKNSQPLSQAASAFNSTTQTAVAQTFRWLAEPVNNNTADASGSLNLLFGTGTAPPTETGLSIASNGQITFPPGQAFPGTGTITSVTAGTDLTGGGTSGDVTLNLDLAKTDARYAQLGVANTFFANQTILGNMYVSNSLGDGITVRTQLPSGNAISATALSGGAAVYASSDEFGVYASSDTYGVYAISGHDGIVGFSTSAGGGGVIGGSTETSGSGVGVIGEAESPIGVGVLAYTYASTGSPIGVEADTSLSPGGIPFAAIGPAGQVFSVAGTGQVKSNSSSANNAASFTKDSFTSPGTLAALQAENAGSNGEVAWLAHTQSGNHAAVVKLVLPTSSTSNFLECHVPDGTRKCHITTAGTYVGGSDFAEALPVRSRRDLYEPGDVLVMSADGKMVQKTSARYSRRVVGVYSVRPAVLGAEKGGESRVDPDDVPVAITGIVPTKVTAENGPIQVGDLLVTSSQPGYAMRATNPRQMLGAVVGKAMEPLAAGRGTVKVLVILR